MSNWPRAPPVLAAPPRMPHVRDRPQVRNPPRDPAIVLCQTCHPAWASSASLGAPCARQPPVSLQKPGPGGKRAPSRLPRAPRQRPAQGKTGHQFGAARPPAASPLPRSSPPQSPFERPPAAPRRLVRVRRVAGLHLPRLPRPLFHLSCPHNEWTYPALVDRVTLTDSGFADHLLSNSSGDRYPRAECRRLRL